MHGFAFMLLIPAFAAEPIEVPDDVAEVTTRTFAMPIRIAPDRRDRIERIRFFVSLDRGKTWKHKQDCKAVDGQVCFKAPKDGVYWFALQVVLKSGKREPSEVDNLTPAMKVYVNSERQAMKVRLPPEEIVRLRAEVASLREENKKLKEDLTRLKARLAGEKKDAVVKLYALTAGKGSDSGKVVFSWTASGEDLAAAPVSLYYRETISASWKLIAAKLPAQGRFAWRRSEGVPDRVFLRCQARGNAGKLTTAETTEKILLEIETGRSP